MFPVAQRDWFLLMDHTVQDWFQRPGWPPAAMHQYKTSVSPPRICLWFWAVQKCVYVVCRIWGSPHMRPSNMSVNHALLVQCSPTNGCLWCESHRTCIWATPRLDDKQMIQETVSPFLSRSLPTGCMACRCELVTWWRRSYSRWLTDRQRGSRCHSRACLNVTR